MFVRNDDINLAYDAALTVTDTNQPSLSRLVEKVGGGHNCWNDDAGSCASIMTRWIENWLGDTAGGGREIVLAPPPSQDPGSSKNFPADPSAFETLIHDPVLEVYCVNCHSSESPNAQQPYFADPDIATAYDAARPKINLDTPANSRLVLRLRNEFHNCWSNSCSNDAQEMEDAITAFANGISPWYGGWGITMNGGRAQASTTASGGLQEVIADPSNGEFSIEAWVIPANVTQEDARIASYSNNDNERNFTLQQTLYNYDFRLRTSETDLNGNPALSTPNDDEVLQATLQHVVATYDPIAGRRIYVNGNLVTNVDPVPGGNFNAWQKDFAFVLGSEAGGSGAWEGTVRLAAVHRRALTQEQVTQNFDVGVGEKFFLLFDISEIIGAALQSSYILFEAQQYDSYAYLFDKPHFVTLDGSTPEGIPIEGMRVAMNGAEIQVGQTYATLNDQLSASLFEELGQPLSILGAVLPLEKGPEDDEFFLTFDRLASNSFDRPDDPTLVITETDLDPVSHIGLRTFDEIDATFGAVLGVDRTDFMNVDMTYQELRQSLPAIEDINTFLSSHQVAVAQLAISYCDAVVNSDGNTDKGQLFPGFNFDAPAATAFRLSDGSNFPNRDTFVGPLIDNIMGTGLASQPAFANVHTELATFQAAGGRPDNLIDRLLNPPPVDGVPSIPSDTRGIAKGVCAAMLGNATTLIQ
jgi:hypothetical protein